MNSNIFAISIGFNKYTDREHLPDLEYAENDAIEFSNVLLDPSYGNIPEQNIKLITGDVTEDEIETTLYRYAFKDRTPEDTVLVYYSGHGFVAGDQEAVFLGTPHVTISQILNNPHAGLKMDYLYSEIFIKSKARNVIFFLDCCHAGAFCPNFKGDPYREKKLVEDHYFSGEGRVAFVSCPKGVLSRESKRYQHGIFTYYLLEGMRREGISRHTGEVTIYQLIDYVGAMCPASQKPVAYGKSMGISLYRPAQQTVDEEPSTFQTYESSTFLALDPKKQVSVSPLSNPIEKQIEYIDCLLQNLLAVESGHEILIGNQVLSSIRRSVGAEFAFIQQVEPDHSMLTKFESEYSVPDVQKEAYKHQVLFDIYSLMVAKNSDLLPIRFGFHTNSENGKDSGKFILVIPLRINYPREFLILSGMKESPLQYGEILGHTLVSLYKVTNELTTIDLNEIEAGILDETKREFGRVPIKAYTRRFDKFVERLNRISFVFEPVTYLGKKELEIDSWEALARDPDSKQAPFDLFQAAELWGPAFTTELDLYCLRNAIAEYIHLWKEERGREKIDQLSVNVYPETLYRSSYKKEIARIVKQEGLLKGKKLILELSEKRPIPSTDQMENAKSDITPLDTFVDKIHEYSRDLNIGFAIDDFGVGYSSASRLARLQLDHVKIDRDILSHPYPDCTIRYVLDMVKRSHPHPVKIVMEGFDGASEITLSQLYGLGIEYVQGYLIRRGSPTVRNLDQEKKDYILGLLQ